MRRRDEPDRREFAWGVRRMSTLYEISVRGPVPAESLAELDDVRRVEHSAETMLITVPLDPDAVLDLMKGLADLGVELEDVRRLASPPSPDGASGEGSPAHGSAA